MLLFEIYIFSIQTVNGGFRKNKNILYIAYMGGNDKLYNYSAVCIIQALLIQKSRKFRQVFMVPAEPIVLHFACKAIS